MSKLAKILLIFMIGAVVGPACDWFHMITTTSGYAHPALAGLAWWVPLLFGFGSVAISLSHVAIYQSRKIALQKIPWSRIYIGLFSFASIYFVSGFLNTTPQRKFVILGVIAMAIWYVLDKTLLGFLLSLGTALFGCLVEISLIKSRIFFYYMPELFGIPLWLPFLYITASVAVGNLGKKIFLEEV